MKNDEQYHHSFSEEMLDEEARYLNELTQYQQS